MEKRDSFQYVPIHETLKRLLEDDSVIGYIDNPHQRSDDFLEDFCDGELLKSHPLFSNDSHALQIIAYFDELEVCNPLGTHTKTHKLAIVLFTLGNIPPKFRSTLRAMNLVACATHPVIEKHGLDAILEPFIKDLNLLTSRGISVNVKGILRTFRGGLLCFLADNAASNALGGFKESFSFSFRFCRTCLATKDSFREHFLPHLFMKRTDTNHKNHCAEIQGPLQDHYSKTYGINRQSKLMDITNFSLFNGGLPHDFMHDILEGVAQLEIKLLVKHMVDLKYISLNEYNRRIVCFDYGSSEGDKPSIITRTILQSDDKKFHLSSSQTLLLCRIFPLLVGDCIPEDDCNWKCFTLLRKIIDIVASPVIYKGQCAILRVLIEEHHSFFCEIYSESFITPKFHFMLHYPDQIILLGPMVRTWTMRYEAKLNLFKRASRLGNFKNIALTLAQRHQRWMCYQTSSGEIFQSDFQCGPGGQPETLANKPQELVGCIRNALSNVSDDATIFNANWVKKNGVRYHSNNCFVIIGSDKNDLIFGRIIELFVISGDFLLFHIQNYKNKYFDDHFQAYVVYESPVRSIVCVDDLLCPFVHNSHKLFDGSPEIYITLKYSFYNSYY